jgi:uncharacterized coiled-coil DUF342 family protein
MSTKSKAQLDKEIEELLNRSDELFARSRNAVDLTDVKQAEFDKIAERSKQLIEELKYINDKDDAAG